ncbi:MAG: hypothetical protein FJX03_07950 [Alphaproteobacteria bacterium]|nr:hypothetical protein [Alphaproteobacteria bacterium]
MQNIIFHQKIFHITYQLIQIKKNEAQTTYQIDIKNLRTQQTFKKDFFNAITKFILIIGSFGVGLSIIKAIVSSSEEIASLLI